jgi:hypothetical protein
MLGQAKKIASFFSSSVIRSQYLSKQIQQFGLTREKCDNYSVSSACDLHRVKLTIPLLDHIIEELEHRFPSEMCDLYNGFYIIPSKFLHCIDVD